MKKLLILTLTIITYSLSFAEGDTHPEIAEIIAETGWSEEELLLGLSRLDNLYQNDMKTEQGRQRWHGPKVNTVIDMDYGTEAITYADGETITLDGRKTAASSVKAANAKLKVSTRGIPAALSALRAKAAQDAATTNTVTITIGGK